MIEIFKNEKIFFVRGVIWYLVGFYSCLLGNNTILSKYILDIIFYRYIWIFKLEYCMSLQVQLMFKWYFPSMCAIILVFMINIKKKNKNILFTEIIKPLFEVLHRLFLWTLQENLTLKIEVLIINEFPQKKNYTFTFEKL